MAEFFDSKEEVLEVGLTDYGKQMYQKGKLNPKYYCFFDDDIIYDASNSYESQNDIQDRILDNTIYLKSIMFGKERRYNYRTEEDFIESFGPKKLSRKEMGYGMLGTSAPNSNYLPSWYMRFSYKYLEQYEQAQTASLNLSNKFDSFGFEDQQSLYVPKVYTITDSLMKHEAVGDRASGYSFPDGSVLHISDNHLLVEVGEENGLLEEDGFEFEVYIMGDEANEVGEKLQFRRDIELIENGLLKPENILLAVKDEEIDSTYVEYYFDLLVDQHAQKYLDNIKKTEDYSDEDFTDEDIYTSDVEQEDVEEVC
jgi:hypothetical protein